MPVDTCWAFMFGQMSRTKELDDTFPNPLTLHTEVWRLPTDCSYNWSLLNVRTSSDDEN